MRYSIKIPLLYFFLFVIVLTANAKDLSVYEVLYKAYLAGYYQGQDQKSEGTITILDSKGNKKTEKFRLFRLKAGDIYKTFIYFEEPVDMAKMAYMVWKNPSGKDERWIYSPQTNKIECIDAKEKRNRFAGSHFVYEEISGRPVGTDTCHFVDAAIADHYLIKCEPKDKSELGYQYYNVWVKKSNFIPVKFEYIDKNGIVMRLVEAKYIAQMDNIPTVLEIINKEVQTGEESIIKLSDVHYNVGLKDSLFTVSNLKEGKLD